MNDNTPPPGASTDAGALRLDGFTDSLVITVYNPDGQPVVQTMLPWGALDEVRARATQPCPLPAAALVEAPPGTPPENPPGT